MLADFNCVDVYVFYYQYYIHRDYRWIEKMDEHALQKLCLACYTHYSSMVKLLFDGHSGYFDANA